MSVLKRMIKMKAILLTVIALVFSFGASSAMANPQLECKVFDVSTGQSSNWSNSCHNTVRYGNMSHVSFRIVNNVDAHSYFWSADGKNFNPNSNTGSLSSPNAGTVKVVVFDNNGNSYPLSATYSVSYLCRNCMIP